MGRSTTQSRNRSGTRWAGSTAYREIIHAILAQHLFIEQEIAVKAIRRSRQHRMRGIGDDLRVRQARGIHAPIMLIASVAMMVPEQRIDGDTLRPNSPARRA